MEKFDIAVIGGGVVGSAIALEAQNLQPHLDVVVLEKKPEPVSETSKFNAGLLHSGLHEPANSLKEALCMRGQVLAVHFAKDNNLRSLKQTGMLCIKSTNLPGALEGAFQERKARLLEKASSLGIKTSLLDAQAVSRTAPAIAAQEGIYVPYIWSVDPEEFSQKVVERAQETGVEFHCNQGVEAGQVGRHGVIIDTATSRYEAGVVINAAGLLADKVAAHLGDTNYRVYPTKGEFYDIQNVERAQGTPDVVHLIMPWQVGKGMHLFKRADTLYLGPNRALTSDVSNHQYPEAAPEQFVRAAQAFYPDAEASELQFAFSGIRARTVDVDQDADFLIEQSQPRVIHVMGIDSPGLTASLAIGAHVARMAYAALK